MTHANRNFEKMTSRARLAYGETDERRERNDKRHKPERVQKVWDHDYNPRLKKDIDKRQKSIVMGG